MNEEGFVQAILATPKNDTPRLIYADWLEEQSDPFSAAKAEFLRLTVELENGTNSRSWKKSARKRLRQLATSLDTNWLAVVSRLRLENCQKHFNDWEDPPQQPLKFDFRCNKEWDDLQPSDDITVRFCEECKQSVHYCDTIGVARQHAWAGHCIAVDLGIIRRDEDLEHQRMWLGMPSEETIRREDERMLPDVVSAERERRKQEARKSETATTQPSPESESVANG